MVNHLLSLFKLIFCALFNSSDTHVVHLKLLSSELFDTGLFCKLLLSIEFSGADLVSVSLHNVSLNASSFLLSLQFTNFLSLKIFLGLSLNEFSLEHLFL